MKQEPDYNQIAKYLAGESSDAEIQVIESLMRQDPEYARMVREFQKIWNTNRGKSGDWDIEGVWERLNREIGRNERKKPQLQTTKIVKRKDFSVRRPKSRWAVRLAAVFVVIAFTSFFASLYFVEEEQNDLLGMKEVTAEPGQRATLQMQDGSRVRLNSGSVLEHPEEFNMEERIVHLSGEAYFEIARDGRPFYVETNDARVEVLGTEFNVQAYEDEENIQVVVAGGEVVVHPFGQTDGEGVYLEPGDMATLPRGNGDLISVSRGVDVSHYLGWMDYRMKFDDTPMKRVAKKLERWYGMDIAFSDPSLAELNVTAAFEDESIHEVLRVIDIALNLNHEIDGQSITLSRNEPE